VGERRYSWSAIPAPGGSVPKGRALGASGFLFFLLLVLMPYSAAGLNQTLNIVAVSSESEYQVGDRATVTIHILSAGAHADASTIDVILNHLRPMQRFVPVEQVATGVYESSFEILAADVLALAVRVSVRASVGGVQDYRIHYLFIDCKEIEVTSSTPRGSPGDLVDITVRIRQNGLLRDAPTLVLVARPLAVLACLLPDRRGRWSRQEVLFLSWTRETGVVPAALAGLVVSMGVPHAELVVVCVALAVIITLALQATTKHALARRLGLIETRLHVPTLAEGETGYDQG